METTILIILTSLILSAFFSGMEIAFVSANRIHIEIEKKKGGFLGKILSKITEKPSRFIATMLVGNNIVVVIYGIFMGELLLELLSGLLPTQNAFIEYLLTDLELLTHTLIATFVILITAEFFSKGILSGLC